MIITIYGYTKYILNRTAFLVSPRFDFIHGPLCPRFLLKKFLRRSQCGPRYRIKRLLRLHHGHKYCREAAQKSRKKPRDFSTHFFMFRGVTYSASQRGHFSKIDHPSRVPLWIQIHFHKNITQSLFPENHVFFTFIFIHHCVHIHKVNICEYSSQ